MEDIMDGLMDAQIHFTVGGSTKGRETGWIDEWTDNGRGSSVMMKKKKKSASYEPVWVVGLDKMLKACRTISRCSRNDIFSNVPVVKVDEINSVKTAILPGRDHSQTENEMLISCWNMQTTHKNRPLHVQPQIQKQYESPPPDLMSFSHTFSLVKNHQSNSVPRSTNDPTVV